MWTAARSCCLKSAQHAASCRETCRRDVHGEETDTQSAAPLEGRPRPADSDGGASVQPGTKVYMTGRTISTQGSLNSNVATVCIYDLLGCLTNTMVVAEIVAEMAY